ncbi:MAG: hypothetical protein RJA22_2769 [Verrucomicrobiota bacterium]|jgi:hypothetical protein
MSDKVIDVFISHSSKDDQYAAAIKQHLTGIGIRCWKAPEDVDPGANWAAAIEWALRNCHMMVLVCSSESLQSSQVTKELTLAMGNRTTVIPLRVEDVAVQGAWRYHLADTHWLDAYRPTFQANLPMVASHISKWLSVQKAGYQPANPATPPTDPKLPEGASQPPGMDESERFRLQQAERLLYSEFQVDEAFEKLWRLYEVHQRRDERLWRAYLHGLAEHDPEQAAVELRELRVDQPQVYAVRVELLLRRGEFAHAATLLKEARQKFGESETWRAQEANALLEEYRQDRDPLLLERAGQILVGLGAETAGWVKAKLDWLKGDRESLQRGREAAAADSLARFRFLQAEKYLTLGPLMLVIGGQEYPCRSGDVIGRHGTVAKAHLASIQTLSRRHAQVLLRAGAWHIRLLANPTNASILDGRPMEPGKFHRLGLEHRVRLSTQCEFELRTTLAT